jgi:hypothetical protein
VIRARHERQATLHQAPQDLLTLLDVRAQQFAPIDQVRI